LRWRPELRRIERESELRSESDTHLSVESCSTDRRGSRSIVAAPGCVGSWIVAHHIGKLRKEAARGRC
jgi:hypothetical protein